MSADRPAQPATLRAALSRGSSVFRRLLEVAPDAMIVADLDGTIVLVNSQVEKLFDWSRDELLGQPVEVLIPNRHQAAHVQHRRGYDANPTARAMGAGRNLSGRRRGGQEFPVDVSLSPLEFGGDRLVIAAVRDITDQKKAKQVLEDSRRKLAEAQEIAHIGSWEWDIRADRVTWSDELYRIYGYEPGAFEVNYQRFLEHTVAEERERVDGIVRRAYETGQFPAYQHPIRRMDGTVRVIHAEGRVEMGDDGKPARMAGIAQDITERMQAQAELAARADELARSNRELEEFADVASHDLQEPLRTVGSFTQLLAREYAATADPKAAEYTQFVLDGVRHMQSLIQDLLSYSRVSRQGRDFESADLGPALQAALAALKASIKEAGASITHDPMPTLGCDAGQLSQVFQNLIGNALKYRGDQPPRIHVGARRSDGGWTLSVADNGIGIEPRHFERIFVIFQRLHTREHYPGTGIGLAVCRKIVHRHGGRIWVESGGAGRGATFLFTLPDRPAPVA